MFFRRISLLLLLVSFSSCQFFTTDTTLNKQKLNAIVDFSKVDVSPSFANCDEFIDKQQKTACFRTTIHQLVAKKLSTYSIKISKTMNETVLVNLLIDANGNIQLKSIESNDIIQQEIPKLDSLVRLSLVGLPKLYPAIKRGIPVTTQYQLPILIQSSK